jgi:hypothetical protein
MPKPEILGILKKFISKSIQNFNIFVRFVAGINFEKILNVKEG